MAWRHRRGEARALPCDLKPDMGTSERHRRETRWDALEKPRSTLDSWRSSTARSGSAMATRCRAVRQKDADLFVEDETESFRDALRQGQTQKGQLEDGVRWTAGFVTAGLVMLSELGAPAQEDDASLWCCEALDAYGRTALHHAMMAPAGAGGRADPNAGDVEGIAPLHLAAQRASKFTIRTLLCARADNQQRSHDGRSTVDFAQLNPAPVEAFEVLGWPGKALGEDGRQM
eukprot:Skav212293  [mRNA]  locus=scaffold732:557772:561904:- [translate_table: standard]